MPLPIRDSHDDSETSDVSSEEGSSSFIEMNSHRSHHHTDSSSDSSPEIASSPSSSLLVPSPPSSSLINENLHDEEIARDAENRAPANPHISPRLLQNAVRDIIREHYICFLLAWIIVILALAVGTFVTFVEMLIVFRRHHGDECDVPLHIFVWLNVATFICKFKVS